MYDSAMNEKSRSQDDRLEALARIQLGPLAFSGERSTITGAFLRPERVTGEVHRLRESYGLSGRAAKALVVAYGESTHPKQWVGGYQRLIQSPGIGKATISEIDACLTRLGFSCLTKKHRKPRKPTSKESRLLKARKNIDKTVRSMGGKIEWTASIENVVQRRSARRKLAVRKWRHTLRNEK